MRVEVTITRIDCDRCGRPITPPEQPTAGPSVTLQDGTTIRLDDLHADCARAVETLLRRLLLRAHPDNGKPEPGENKPDGDGDGGDGEHVEPAAPILVGTTTATELRAAGVDLEAAGIECSPEPVAEEPAPVADAGTVDASEYPPPADSDGDAPADEDTGGLLDPSVDEDLPAFHPGDRVRLGIGGVDTGEVIEVAGQQITVAMDRPPGMPGRRKHVVQNVLNVSRLAPPEQRTLPRVTDNPTLNHRYTYELDTIVRIDLGTPAVTGLGHVVSRMIVQGIEVYDVEVARRIYRRRVDEITPGPAPDAHLVGETP